MLGYLDSTLDLLMEMLVPHGTAVKRAVKTRPYVIQSKTWAFNTRCHCFATYKLYRSLASSGKHSKNKLLYEILLQVTSKMYHSG